MRILYVITSFRIGGAERLTTNLLPLLKTAGINVEVAVFDSTPTRFLSEVESSGITIHKLSMGYKSMYNPLNIYKLQKLISKNNYDIIHTHNSSCQLFTAIATKISNTNPMLITTEHNTTNRRRYWKWYKAIDRWMYDQYDSIVCCSDSVKLNLERSCIITDNSKQHTIANGIEIPPSTMEHVNLTGRAVVMVSGFRPQKDHLTAVKAMAYLPDDVHLYFAGEGTTIGSVKDFVTKSNLDSRIHFLGNVDNVSALFASARCALLSTHYEGMPLSIIEAMASGTPVIASAVPGVTEIVADAGLLFPESDPKALAESILRVIDDSPERTRLIATGLKRAANYDIKDTVKQYINLYTNLISKHK